VRPDPGSAMSSTKPKLIVDPQGSRTRYRDPVHLGSATRPPRILVGLLTGELDAPVSAPATPAATERER